MLGGNLRVYDITRKLNINKLKPDFDRLTLDVCVKEELRKKNIKHMPLNIDRVHPGDPEEMGKLIQFFISKAPIRESARLHIQAQRITCHPYQEGHPAVKGWHRDGVTAIGVACINRHNIEGGVSEFRDKTGNVTRVLLQPGNIIIFDDTTVMHRVTPIHILDKNKPHGHRDVILMSYS